MFKIGVIGDEVSQDFQTLVNVATELNLDSIEIRSVWDKPPQDLTAQDIDEMKRILDGTALQIIGIASPFFKCDIDNMEERREHLGILKACIKLAKAFDTNLIRTFVFWDTGKTEERWDEIISAYDEPVRIAEGEGIMLGMENESSTSLRTAKLTERFIREFDSPNVRAIWDPANEAHAEGGETPYPDAYNRLKPLMVHAHLKDAGRNPDTGEMESVPVGDGVVDWQGQLQAFIDDGYEGHLCLETHWRPTLKIDDDLLNRPGGQAFSEAGEEASRICLQNLFAMIAKLKQ
ncbi:MAG: sugar phosphate isomerase/epimerase [Candidatus Poribacteria bacterium]|nr:sugar phosphate isomerase/epimerase [Candidatus Poribacteria bacterium]